MTMYLIVKPFDPTMMSIKSATVTTVIVIETADHGQTVEQTRVAIQAHTLPVIMSRM